MTMKLVGTHSEGPVRFKNKKKLFESSHFKELGMRAALAFTSLFAWNDRRTLDPDPLLILSPPLLLPAIRSGLVGGALSKVGFCLDPASLISFSPLRQATPSPRILRVCCVCLYSAGFCLDTPLISFSPLGRASPSLRIVYDYLFHLFWL